MDSAETAAALIDYVHASPSPFHAVATTATTLATHGFSPVDPAEPLPAKPGRYYLVRGGSLIAWSTEHEPAAATGFRLVGAHTDSPNLRIKPQPGRAQSGYQQLGVEVYGGPLLNSWLDRDLGLSGRVAIRAEARMGNDDNPAVRRSPDANPPRGVQTVLIHLDEPLLRVAQLAVHLDRGVNNDGVKLNPQQHLAPIWGLGAEPRDFTVFLAERIGVEPGDVLAWDIMTHDVQRPARIGADREFIASARLDNLATGFAGMRALLSACDALAAALRGDLSSPIPVLAIFDHEEVGSVSERGAASELLPTVLERVVHSLGGDRDTFARAMARTVIASGDMAHATHPNYTDRHEPDHQIRLGGGPVLKVNNQLRYATGAPGAAAFALACEQAGVPMQRFVTRSDLPCGSTVGPVTAARTGAETVDFGAPMLSMHSARELTSVDDMAMYVAALGAFLSPRS